MMKLTYKIIALFMLSLSLNASVNSGDLDTVDFVDLEKYQGTWYEIARYENSFQKKCLGTKAEYGKWFHYITVKNTCQLSNGKERVGKALATVADKKSNARLKVSFVPILNLFGFFSGDYNILHLGPDYDYSLVGDQERKTFWILAREKEIPPALYDELLDIAEEKGFDRNKITRSPIWNE